MRERDWAGGRIFATTEERSLLALAAFKFKNYSHRKKTQHTQDETKLIHDSTEVCSEYISKGISILSEQAYIYIYTSHPSCVLVGVL